MLVGCYVLHLYCDGCNASWNGGNGSEKTLREAKQVAVSDGWLIKGGGKSGVAVWCERCKKEKKPKLTPIERAAR